MTDGDRGLLIVVAGILLVWIVAGIPEVSADATLALDGYAEWTTPDALIVDGQRVIVDRDTKWMGAIATHDAVRPGDAVRLRGVRRADAAVLARAIDIRPNKETLLEDYVRKGTDDLERLWLQRGEAFQTNSTGRPIPLGRVVTDGPAVDRVKRIASRLAPPYVDQSRLRVYVIDNREWNAMAMGNGSIWVFRGMLDDMSDNSLAIVVGHELAHYTHEHPLRQLQKNLWIQAGNVAALAAIAVIDSSGWQALARLGGMLGFSAWSNQYSRGLEDQADRVGLRYAHEAGFDVSDAPAVWQRFLDKYGDGNRVTSFFFSDHSSAAARRANLEQELRLNYSRGQD